MHGTIMGEMKKFVNDEFGFGTWSNLLDEAGYAGKSYSPTEVYPDSEAVAILEAASGETGLSVQDILHQFGQFLGPSLLETYSGLIDDSWNTLDLIQHTEEKIHTEVRKRTSDAKPPDLSNVERLSDGELVLHYQSDRQMCPLARGIAESVADYNGESLSVDEPQCMLEGDSECELHFTLN